jgi:hypothetical protein
MNKYIIGAVVIVSIFIGGYQVGISTKSTTNIVETEKEVKRNDITTVVKEVKKADGTIEIITTTVDKTKETVDKRIATAISTARENLYHVAIASDHAIKGTQGLYSLTIERTLISSFTLGIKADTDKNVGVVLGFNF